MAKLKLSLDDLKVQSFVTSLNDEQQLAVRGGVSRACDTDLQCYVDTVTACDSLIYCDTNFACTSNSACDTMFICLTGDTCI